MKKDYEPLFTPWKIGDVEIKNRIVMTSMGGTSIFGWMEPHHFDKEAAKFLLDKARNGAGLILPGIAPIRNVLFNRWLYQNKGMFKKLKVFMDEVHETGAKMFVQLTAGFGRSFAISHVIEAIGTNPVLNVIAKPILDVDYLCASSSPNPNRWSDKIKTREVSVKEIKKMIEAFAKTSKLCKDAGVDGVEIHAVHEGYLLDQFTMKYTNQRSDEYGGSLENRYRFPIEIVKAIKEACGDDYPVSLRYSVVSKTKDFRKGALPGEEYVEVGRDMEESELAVKMLEEAGYDMLNCDNGTYDAWYWAHPPGYMPLNCNLEYVEHIKKFVNIPVVVAGRMTPGVAAKSISEGKIDAMGVARQFLADSEWIIKLQEDRLDDIRPCICCHNACFTMANYKGVANDQSLSDTMHMSRCAVNPETMQSKKYSIKKAKKSKSIAIIGGGIGGMEVARVATLRGHKVKIYEKSDHLGGIFVPASSMSFKEKERELLEWFKKNIKDLNIEVEYNREIKSIDEISADEIVIATGSSPRRLNLKGIEKTIETCEYLDGSSEVGEKVVVIGGGLTGCEVAYDLYLKGKKPVIIEAKQDLIAQTGVCLANSSYLREFFELNKVPSFLETQAKEILDDKVIATNKDGKEIVIECDSVIMAIGYKPSPIVNKSKHVHLVGDCNGVGNLRSVIWRAWDVAMKF